MFRTGDEAWAAEWWGSGGGRVSLYPTEGANKGRRLYLFEKDIRRLYPDEIAARRQKDREREAEALVAHRAWVAAERERIERERRAWEAARAARGPINAPLVADDLREAISSARAAGRRQGTGAILRADLIRPAVEWVRLRHALEPDELLKIANEAKVYIHSNGLTFDITGRRLRERLGEGK